MTHDARAAAQRGAGQTVGDIGEFALIDAVNERLADVLGGPNVLLGTGDDAAVIAASDGRTVVSTDLLGAGWHWRDDWSEPADVGARAAAASASDIAAMGGRTTALVVGLAVPAELATSWVLGLADGLAAECSAAGIAVVGGDVVRSETVVVSVTALGDLGGRDAVRRSGARPGDLVAFAGRLGWAAAGLAVLRRGFRSPRVLVDAYRRPVPPYDEGPRAADLGATAMTDVSDGLVADLRHVATASEVAIHVASEAIHVPQELHDTARALGTDPLEWLLSGGEDHALVATFPPDVDLPMAWSVIGRVAEGDGVWVDGEREDRDGGWRSF